MQVSVITYGGGQVLHELFNAIAAIAGGPTYASLLKIALIVGMSWFLFDGILRRRHIQAGLKWLVAYYITFNILLLPKVQVQLIDRIDINHQFAVAGVPWGVAVPASIGSHIRDALTQKFEEVFSLPDDLKYGHTGMVMASKMVIAASSFEITDPNFRRDLNSFVNQCVFYDVLLHKVSMKELLETGDIWGLVSAKASRARAFLYQGKIVTCQQGASLLSRDWNAVINEAASSYGSHFFPGEQEEKSKSLLLSRLPVAYQYLTGLSLSASQILQQNIMSNAIESGLKNFATRVNASSALENFAFTKAQAAKRQVYQTLGDQAAYWVPIMQNVFEALIYGSFLLILPFMLLPIGLPMLRSYFMSIIWIGLWSPLFAILNMVVTLFAATHSHGAVVAGGKSALSLMTQAGLSQTNHDMSLLAGYLSLSIPFLSYGIISRGIAPAFSQLAQYVGGITQYTGQMAAMEAVSGNISQGNLQFDNNNAFNTSAYHWDTSGSAHSGQFSSNLSDGAVLTRTADGHQVLQSGGALSNSATSVHLASAIRESATQQMEHSFQTGLSQTHAASQAVTAGLRDMVDYSHAHSQSEASGDSSSLSHSSNVSDAMSNVDHLVDRFASDHHISAQESESVLGTYYANYEGSAGVDSNKEVIGKIVGWGTGMSAKANVTMGHRHEGTHSQQVNEQALMQAAHSFDQQTGFTHQVDMAVRTVQEQSFRSGSEENERLSSGVSSHFERANSLRTEAQASFNQAESFREMASYAKEKSASIDENASSDFVDWMSGQPDPGGHGAMGITQAESILNHNHDLGMHYAEQYVSQQSQSWMNKWESDLHNQSAIQQDFQSNQKLIGNESTLETLGQAQKVAVQQAGAGIQPVFHTVSQAVSDFNQNPAGQIKQEKQRIDQGGKKIEKSYQENLKGVRHAVNKTSEKSK